MRSSMLCRAFVVLLASSLVVGVAFAQSPPPTEPAPAPAPAPAAAPAAPAAPVGAMVDKIKIVVDNKAKSTGEISFRFVPQGGAGKDIRVTIQEGMGKKDVCQDIAKELSIALGDGFKVDQYDKDKIKVEGRGKNVMFSLTITALTVNGLSVMLK